MRDALLRFPAGLDENEADQLPLGLVRGLFANLFQGEIGKVDSTAVRHQHVASAGDNRTATNGDGSTAGFLGPAGSVAYDTLALAEHDDSLKHILKLAHVPRPGISDSLTRLPGSALDGASPFDSANTLYVVIDKNRNVLRPVAERLEDDRNGAQPVIEIIPETPSSTSLSRSRLVAAMTQTSA